MTNAIHSDNSTHTTAEELPLDTAQGRLSPSANTADRSGHIEGYAEDSPRIWIEVFRTGTHTDSEGNERAWTEEDLDAIASTYDPSRHEAPLVIGHPKDNSPAYGWVERLERAGDRLRALVKPTVGEFVEWVRRGVYKKVSISLYGNLRLRHIGFLGGNPPAVKGLAMPQFAEQEYIEYEMDSADSHIRTEEDNDRESAGDNDRPYSVSEYREGVQGVFSWYGMLTPDATHKRAIRELPLHSENEDMSHLEGALTRDGEEQGGLEMKEKVTELETQLGELRKRYQGLQVKFQETDEAKQKALDELNRLRMQTRKLEYEQTLNEWIAYGQMTPAQKETAMQILEFLGTINFSEGEKSPVETFKEFVLAAPKQIEFKEIATKEKSGTDASYDTHDLKIAGKRTAVDPDKLEIHKKAKALQKAKNISYSEAVDQVMKKL